jgi:hypothetical protein
MSSSAVAGDYGAWRFSRLQELVDELLADPKGLDDVAELEHAALALRAPFDVLDAPPAVAADLSLALERRDDELAAGLLAALAAFSYQPLAREAANALARLSGRGRVSPLARRIATLEVIDASCHRLPGIDLVLAQLQRPSESRAQVAMLAFDSYPCGTVISHLEVTPPQPIEAARAGLRARVRGSTPRPLEIAELLDQLRAAVDHMHAHAVPLDGEAAVWLPALERALTGCPTALPRLAVEEPEPAIGTAPKRGPLDSTPEVIGDQSHRIDNDRRQAKRRASRAARRRNRR